MTTLKYYARKLESYVKRTMDIDMSERYAAFEAYLRPEAHILDAGCGPGRDTRYFLERGYQVTAFDASPEMAHYAAQFTGQGVSTMRFQEMNDESSFDGIWTCASLLHVPKSEIEDVMRRCIQALKPGGVWYMCFKDGDGEEERGGRFFNDYSDEKLKELLKGFCEIELRRVWRSPHVKIDHPAVDWINAIVQRVEPR